MMLFVRRKSTKKQGKVKNATPNEYDGIKFRSKLETYTYKKLKEAKIKADYEKHRFELLPAFTFGEKKYRPMTYLPDFVGDGFIIECKGFGNELFPMRWKLFKRYLMLNNLDYDLYICKNKKEINDLIYDIKRKEYDVQMSNMR